MSKQWQVATWVGVLAAALLVLFVLFIPAGSVLRLLAAASWLALVVLVLLWATARREELHALTGANSDLEQELGQLRREISDTNAVSQSVLDGISDPAIVLDKDYRVTALNRAARDKVESEGGIDDPLRCFSTLLGRDAPCDEEGYPCVLCTTDSCEHIQRRVQQDGSERWLELRATPIYGEDGKLIGAVEVAHNLDEEELLALRQQRAQEEESTARAAKARFVATTSHELRTPLNAVLGMVDLLRLTALTRKQEGYLQIMESSSNMLLSIVDNMIDFAMIESGVFQLTRAAFRVNDLLERTLQIMGYQAYAKGIELAGTGDFEPHCMLSGDVNRLQQIIINLVSNAIKFTDKGVVVVRIAVEPGDVGQSMLSVSVADTGAGMPEDASKRVFQPFGSINSDRGAGRRGGGLGLAISKQLLDLMDGVIDFESELERGTTVCFKVPLAAVAGDQCPEGDDGAAALGGHRMLLVNLNPEVAGAIAGFLDTWGIQSQLESAPEKVSQRITASAEAGSPFDGLVLDPGNAAGDRLAVARSLRRQTGLPILLLTSIAQPLEVGQISQIGSVRCVNKPVLPGSLRHNLLRLYEHESDEIRPSEGASDALTVLLAEDNPINRKLMRGMLKSLDVAIDTVDNGPAALAAIENKPYDLILMDCQMPGMDGDEVTRIVRESSRRGSQPVIVAVTADVSAEHKIQCLAAGMDDFLPKPVRLETLKTGLQRWSLMANVRHGRLPDTREGGAYDAAEIISRLRNRVGLDHDKALEEYVSLFIDDTVSRLEVMQDALRSCDLEALRRHCHTLKGAALEMGLQRLSDACESLGSASRDKRLGDLPLEFYQLLAEFERVRPVFEAGKKRG